MLFDLDKFDYRVLGLVVFSYDEVFPDEEGATYRNIDSDFGLLHSYNGHDVSITDEGEFMVFDGMELVRSFRLEEDVSFREEMIRYLSTY